MNTNETISLLGHLQVLDEPLSSLYADRTRGVLYLFVRLFEATPVSTFILTEVTPTQVMDYMEGRLGLNGIFKNNKAFYYVGVHVTLNATDFKPLTKAKACEKLGNNGLDDMFDRQLAYRSVPLKQYLRNMMV